MLWRFRAPGLKLATQDSASRKKTNTSSRTMAEIMAILRSSVTRSTGTAPSFLSFTFLHQVLQSHCQQKAWGQHRLLPKAAPQCDCRVPGRPPCMHATASVHSMKFPCNKLCEFLPAILPHSLLLMIPQNNHGHCIIQNKQMQART